MNLADIRPMYAVLYTHQLEPITVVQLQPWLWERLAKGQGIQLAVMEPVPMSFEDGPPIDICERTVTIIGERLRRRGHETLMLFTADEESALMLKAEFLPGQRGELNHQRRTAFAKGFLQALNNYS